MPTQKEVIHSSRVSKLIHEQKDKGLRITINEATKSIENHGHLSYIIYSISIGNNLDQLIVKRRYSEFETLRNCLIKSFPTTVIPPIPEKQSLKSNIQTTTGLKRNTVISSTSNHDHHHNFSNNNDNSNTGVNGSNGDNMAGTTNATSDNSNTNNNASQSITVNNNSSSSTYVEYRKRMLSVFLNRCLLIDKVSKNFFFLNFLDPEINFNDFIDNSKEYTTLLKLSICRVNPVNPLGDLNNQLYLTLPIPSSSASLTFHEGEDETSVQELASQIEKCKQIEIKFQRYESVLNNISKINKKLIKDLIDISLDYSELASNIKELSLIQDSDYIEEVSKVFDRNFEVFKSISDCIQLKFLDKIIELKNFNKTVSYLIEFNKQKIVQFNLVNQSLVENAHKLKDYERQDEEIKKIDQRVNRTTQTINSSQTTEPPITDEELQSSLYLQSQKSSITKIPGFSKLNNLVSSITDSNPEQTRKNKLHSLRLKNYQLTKQKALLIQDNQLINENVLNELDSFYHWFKTDLSCLIKDYNQFLVDYLYADIEAWEESYNI